MEVNRVWVDFMLTLTLLSIQVNTSILHPLQREWDSWKDGSSVGLSVMFYSSHTHDTQYSEVIRMASGYDNAGWLSYVKMLNIPQNATHFIWQLWVINPGCRFYSNCFLNMKYDTENTFLIYIDLSDLIIHSSWKKSLFTFQWNPFSM